MKAISRTLSKTAIIDRFGSYSYPQLRQSAATVRSSLLTDYNASHLIGTRVALLCPHDYTFIASHLGITAAGGVTVPLCPDHPPAELNYFLEDSCSQILITHPDYESLVKELKFSQFRKYQILKISHQTLKTKPTQTEEFSELLKDEDPSVIFYTSGTTGKPKGVVHTSTSIEAQETSMIESWRWSSEDQILNVLPFHHIHGFVNCLTTPLRAGACVHILHHYSPKAVWNYLLKQEEGELDETNVFMAVPTVYAGLINYFEQKLVSRKEEVKTKLRRNLRLMVCGSAALPTYFFQKWREISGHRLLQRYGMSELGMALTNPYEEQKRLPGTVGFPFPGVEAKIMNEGKECSSNEPGELYIKGKNIFSKYFNRELETLKDMEGEWFKTGDEAVRDDEGRYSILGRKSVDILKCAGYKLSALQIERVFLEHPLIAEIAVIGVPDQKLGDKVVAIIKPRAGLQDTKQLTGRILREWGSDKLAKYKLPREVKLVKEILKNQMGKVNKKELLKKFKEGALQ